MGISSTDCWEGLRIQSGKVLIVIRVSVFRGPFRKRMDLSYLCGFLIHPSVWHTVGVQRMFTE